MKRMDPIHSKMSINLCNRFVREFIKIRISPLELIMLVGEFSGRYKTILIFIFIFEDVFYHCVMMCVIGRVSVFLKFLPNVMKHLKYTQKTAQFML